MAAIVETLDKLERKMTLTLPAGSIQTEIDTRLRRIARTVKMDGFRPGKVPMNVVSQRYGYSVQYEVMNDKIGQAFFTAANEAKLRVAGQPRITEKADAPDGEVAFEAVFEVFPEVKVNDLSGVQVEKITTDVTEEAIERTLTILRTQRRTFSQRPQSEPARASDRVTVDFEGKIDGEAFAGGKAEAYQFMLGEEGMLRDFDDAVRGMKHGESRTFPLTFPADYQSTDVAGKQADFMVTVKKIEAAHLPEVNDALAKALGISEGTVEALRGDIRKNLVREVKARVLARNKQAVMDALMSRAELDLPKASVQDELERLMANARADLKKRGVKDAESAPLPEELFKPQAERRVRLGLVIAEVVRANKLSATPDQVKEHVAELASSYEKPAEVVRWYYGDRDRLAEVEAIVIENNVTNFVLERAQVVEKSIPFDDLMGKS